MTSVIEQSAASDSATQDRVTDRPDDCSDIRKDLDGPRKWAENNEIKFNQGKTLGVSKM